MRLPISTALAALLCCGGLAASGQELRPHPIPFSVWLDFEALSAPQPPPVSLPIWLESVTAERPRVPAGEEPRTIYRLRLRRLGALNREVQLRVFFEDLPGISPSLTGWTETGTVRYVSGPLGSGLGLPTSETLLVPVEGVDYLDLSVPGSGTTIRGLFVSSVKQGETRFALDFPLAAGFSDPFGQPAPLASGEADSLLLGRVKAVLESGPLKLSASTPGTWDFQLDRVPALALLTFEILNADLANLPAAALNGRALGPVSLVLPDLADPAYRPQTVAREADPRFHYTGWLRAQLAIPGSALHQGVNELDLVLGVQSRAVALRVVELQLKFPASDTPAP